MLEKGKTPIQETRGWNSEKGITYSQRTKEGAHDYRYFPGPDIPPFNFEDSYIDMITNTIPELPKAKMDRFLKVFAVKDLDAYILTRDKRIAELFEKTLNEKLIKDNKISAQWVSNIFTNKLLKKLSLQKTSELLAQEANELVKLSSSIAKEIYDSYVLKNELKTVDLPKEVVEKVIGLFPNVVADYKGGKLTAIMFLVGQVMKEMKGIADANTVRKALEEKIK
jgi:aspartyl-tRNA(Asn)/glutamyl-tRNA(Gln) amidotransferase subunit B